MGARVLNTKWLTGARSALMDCVSSREHSCDFDYYRSELLIVRVRFFAALFGIASPIWFPIDRWLLPEDIHGSMLWLRVITGLAMLSMALLPARPTLAGARIRVAVLMVMTLAFYLAVQTLAGATFMTPALIGYTALPLLLVAILALLPLTLTESAVLQISIGMTMVGTHIWLGELADKGVLGLLWVLVLFIGFALMAQGIQLHLLLMIHRQATRDSLTGLFNRGAFLRQAELILGESNERGMPYTVLMLDLDRFKQINDTYGHLAGDDILRAVALELDRQVTPTSLPGRFGGEEFLLLLADTRLPQALQQAEHLRHAIACLVVQTGSGPVVVTTSIGVAEGQPGEALEDVVRRADQALYAAKETGRNLVAC